MNEKRGQITVFIIIGLIILFVIGTVLYLTRTQVTKKFEAVRPKVVELPQQVQPLRDLVESCVRRLATDGLRKIGDSGGYIEDSALSINPTSVTEGEAVQLSPGARPNVAYWWYMSDKNDCKQDCQFETKRPGLYRSDGGENIEAQLDEYVTNNLKACLGNFEDFVKHGCTVQERGAPKVTANVAQDDVFFVGKYALRAVCGDQTFDVEDFYVNIDVNLREIYELGTELANLQATNHYLEQATKTVISAYSDVDPSKLPPPRAFEVGPPKPGVFWIKFQVREKVIQLLTTYVPLIQASGVHNYQYIPAPAGTRDPEQFELLYNRQFFLPLNSTHPRLDVRFMYLDWWKPYFDLNCNGQLCQADSASNFALLPFSMNRYQFTYDISFPALVEIRNPSSFNNEGYSFKFFLEENMRNSDVFKTEGIPSVNIEPSATCVADAKATLSKECVDGKPAETFCNDAWVEQHAKELCRKKQPPSIFCDPAQQTSGTVGLNVIDGLTLRGLDEGSVSYLCGNNNCNLGFTQNGSFVSKFPRCIGGTLRITKAGYGSYSSPLDTDREQTINVTVTLEPIRTLNATVKNLQITKGGKHEPWEFQEASGLLRPHEGQQTTIALTRNSTAYEEPFSTVVDIKGAGSGELLILPGKYHVTINAFLKENITIPPDHRCFKIRKLFGSKKKCFDIPEEPIKFNETSPFPYGSAEYDYEITPAMLRGATKIEFRTFVLAIDSVSEPNRIVEDLSELEKVKLYSTANIDRITPVIS